MIYNTYILNNPMIFGEAEAVFTLNAIGIDTRHTGNFEINRPHGSGDCLLIIFRTDAALFLDGKEISAPPDSAVIFPLGAEQHYRSVCGSYVNHFMHFECGEGFEGLPVRSGELILPNGSKEPEELLRMISREHMSESGSREMCIDMLIKLLLVKLSEQRAAPSARLRSAHSEMLSELRAELHSSAGQFRSVAQLAERANLSPSHFQQLYKQQFGISCYEDLLSAKMKTAQYYLGATMLTVKEIAALCGYDNELCFMHRFKERTGLTPTEYRRKFF